MNFNIGDKIQIHCYKHNGKLNSISKNTIVLDETKEMLVCANYHAKLFDYDGKSHRTKEPAILFFFKDSWFNVIAQFKKYGLFYYCNIASPYVIDDNVIKYIDYDLDLRVFPDGSHKVLDKNEYKFHKKIMRYSSDIDLIVNEELKKLIILKNGNKGPFNVKILSEYYEKFIKLSEK